MVHREVADQPRVWIIFIRCHDLSDGGQIEYVPLRSGPHPLKHNQNTHSAGDQRKSRILLIKWPTCFISLKVPLSDITLCVW